MKKLILLLALPFLFFSCGDDEEEYLDTSIIEGTWWWDDGLFQEYIVFYGGNSARKFALDKYTGEYFMVNDFDKTIRYTDVKLTKYRIFMTRVGSSIGAQNGKVSQPNYELKGDSILVLWKIPYKKVDPPTLPK